MTDDPDAFAAHDRLRPTEDGAVRIESVVFDAIAEPVDGTTFELRVVVPTIEAAVTADEVGETVAEGWFETFERRLADPGGALVGDVESVTVERDGADVLVTIRAEGPTPDVRADDAASAAEFVEGTYVEGLIPGYAYREPVADLQAAARQRYDG